MATTVTVKVEGIAALAQKMRGLSDKLNKSIATSVTGAGAKIIKTKAVQNIVSSPSVDTGSLRDAVIVKKIPKSQTTLASEHIVTVRGRGKPRVNKKGVKQAQAPHAHFVEFGTVNMPAEPFLRPALDTEAQKAINAMKDRFAKRLDEAAK